MRLFKSVPGPEQIQAVQISSATNAMPTQIAYGTPRVAGNLIWLNGFTASPAPTSSGKGGGKDVSAYVYNAYFLMGICEGPTGDPLNNGSFVGKPTSNQVVYTYVFPAGPVIATGGQFAGWFYARSGATNGNQFLVFRNSSVVGVITFPGGSAGGITAGTVELFADTTFNIGDSLQITAPAVSDPTLGDFFFSFMTSQPPDIKYVDGTAYAFSFTYFTKDQTLSELDFLDGGYATSPTPVIESNWPAEALAYRGVTMVFGPNYRIDASATVPQLQFVLPGKFVGTCPLNKSTIPLFVQTPPYTTIEIDIGYADADPALCIVDLLTHPIYGVGFPSALIDPSIFTPIATPAGGDASFQTYCQAVGLGFGVVLDSAESANSILQRWCDLCNTAPVWTGTSLKFIPYGDQAYSENPGWGSDNPLGIPQKTFVPNVTPIYALDDDSFEQSRQPTDDPVTIERKDVADKYNTVRLAFKDRTNAWNENVAEAKDENSIELYGIRVDNLETAHEFSISQYAAISAQLRVQRNVSVDRTYHCRLSWAYCLLEPMDVVTLTEPNIGVNGQLARVISIEEDEHQILDVTFEVLPLGSSTAVLYPKQASTPSTGFYTGATPSVVHVPVIFEPTLALLQAQSQSGPTIACGVCGGISNTADPNWGGAVLYISLDNVTYSLLGTINGPSRMGSITANLTGGSSTIPVDVTESGAQLDSVGATDFSNNVTLCVLTNSAYSKLEFFSYENATLTSAFKYNLTPVTRGLYGTSAQSWNSGDLFLRFDPATFQAPLPPQYVGQTIFIKFLSFNTTGLITESLASAPLYSYVPGGSGLNQVVVAGSFTGMPPAGGVLQNFVFSQQTQFLAGLPGSKGFATVGATALATCFIQKNGVNIGTMLFAGGGGGGNEVATFTFATKTTFNVGDIMTVVAPNPQDASLASLGWSIVGQAI